MYMKQLQGDTAKMIVAQISSTGMACGYVGISTDSKVADEIKRHENFADNQFGISGTGGITFNEKNAEMQEEYAEKTGETDSLIWIGFDRYAQEDEIRYCPYLPMADQLPAETAEEIIAARWSGAEENAESLIDVIDTAKAVADVVEEKERSLQAEKSR